MQQPESKQTNAPTRRAQNIIFEMRENEPAGSSHRLSRLKYTGRVSCTLYATPPAVGCEVIFGGQSWRAAKRREPTTNNTVRAPLKNLWCSLARLIIPISSFGVGFTDNSQVCQRSWTLDSHNSFALPNMKNYIALSILLSGLCFGSTRAALRAAEIQSEGNRMLATDEPTGFEPTPNAEPVSAPSPAAGGDDTVCAEQ